MNILPVHLHWKKFPKIRTLPRMPKKPHPIPFPKMPKESEPEAEPEPPPKIPENPPIQKSQPKVSRPIVNTKVKTTKKSPNYVLWGILVVAIVVVGLFAFNEKPVVDEEGNVITPVVSTVDDTSEKAIKEEIYKHMDLVTKFQQQTQAGGGYITGMPACDYKITKWHDPQHKDGKSYSRVEYEIYLDAPPPAKMWYDFDVIFIVEGDRVIGQTSRTYVIHYTDISGKEGSSEKMAW